MQVFSDFFQTVVTLLDTVKSGNDTWQFLVSLAILIFGFLLLEFLWRHFNKRIQATLERKGVKKWLPYLSGFLPSLRLAVAALLLRATEIPLVIPRKLLLLLHGLEAFLFAIACIIFIFQLVRFLDLLPGALQDKTSEPFLKRFRGVIRISSLVIAAILFSYSQQHLFPEWLWESSWWLYMLLVLVYTILYIGGKLLTTFLSTLTVALRDDEEKARLRLLLKAALWPIRLLLLAIAIYATQEILKLPATTDQIIEIVINIVGTLVVVVFLYQMLDVVEYELTKFVRREDNEFDMNFVQMIRIFSKVLIVMVGSIYLLKAATGKPMTTLLAGLGIGGLAVALAAQDTLKNLFGSFMIMVDKPFKVGDRVVAEGFDGYVEEIGFRSTRLRSLTGHLISMPNEKMASVSIENIGMRPSIRRYTNITITYDTPVEKVERAVSIIREILKDHRGMHPDYPPRVHFDEFNDASLNIAMFYWFHPPDYWEAIKFDEEVNLRIMRAFEAEGIEFAFPTTTTYLAQDDRRPLTISLSKDLNQDNER
ncbi:MAG: mechanosensitive ion channel family protein [Deltaproteobacteria bacterium]|nr:mechanosensitive ion channel family protein [Deltaproteobacteria bacterium]